MPRPLNESVVAITGASSGIGRAAALRLARRGAALALCARSPGPLRAVAEECEAAGARGVLIMPLDVGEEAAVEAFAGEAVERFGRLDVWVNNAGVIAYGEFGELPSEVFRRVIETNLMGQVHGARAALRCFREQGSGVLINMSSVWGRVSSPQVSPYVISKNAVRALSECLRGELAGEEDIYVTTMAPQAVDTPIFDHAANYTGHRIRPVPPVRPVEEIAAGIEACAESPKREVNYGRAGRLLEILYVLAPTLYRRLAHRAFMRGTLAPIAASPASGNVLASTGPYEIDGSWRRRRRPSLRRAFLAAGTGAVAGLWGGVGADPTAPPTGGKGLGALVRVKPGRRRKRNPQKRRPLMATQETGEVTGTKDKDYNVIWFTEQCLSNVLRLETYIEDADREGDSELADFFRRAQETSRKGAEQGKDLLRNRLAS
jgi:NAD(P)-dependent dehydrogenase (short-subunit alcohol dehydrogenase family)